MASWVMRYSAFLACLVFLALSGSASANEESGQATGCGESRYLGQGLWERAEHQLVERTFLEDPDHAEGEQSPDSSKEACTDASNERQPRRSAVPDYPHCPVVFMNETGSGVHLSCLAPVPYMPTIVNNALYTATFNADNGVNHFWPL